MQLSAGMGSLAVYGNGIDFLINFVVSRFMVNPVRRQGYVSKFRYHHSLWLEENSGDSGFLPAKDKRYE